MPFSFYSEKEYKKKQSELTKLSWQKGEHNSLIKPLETRHCKNPQCKNLFKVKPYEDKIFCSSSCAAHINNKGRILSLATKLKMSKTHLLLPKYLFKNKLLPRVKLTCHGCRKEFQVCPYLAKTRKYCSTHCAITTIGSMTTSPKASKGKPGIRKDIDPNICFYSTWEANVARVFNLIKLKWVYAPKTFNLGEHTYRPDFYLPDFDMYIEVKNFMGEYSLKRDTLFRRKYPDIKLELIMKKEYLEIKNNYKYFIKNWEY